MQFIQSFLLVASGLLLLYMAQHSFTHRKTPGAFAFFIVLTAALIWTLASFAELHAVTLQGKVLWRNIEQIGVFGTPISTVYFALDYTRNTKYKKYIYAAAMPSLLAVMLIFTNEWHHWMRLGVSLEPSSVFGESLVVHSTVFGSILVAYNFVLPLVAVAILLCFAGKVSRDFRRQVYYIVISFLLTFAVAWVKTAILEGLGFYMHISVLYTPSALIMFYCVFKHRTFSLSPVARDKVFEVINQGIVVMDEDSTIIDANSDALSTLADYFDIADPFGLKLTNVNTRYPALNALIGSPKEEQLNITVQQQTDEAHLSLNYHPLYHSKNDFIGSVLIINDITVQKLFERSLEEKAEKDFLTHIYNKFGIQKALVQSIYPKDGPFQSYSVLMIDVDNFKQLNDTIGHAGGDRVLRHFSTILQSLIRADDIVGRIGGDEFVVVLPRAQKETALPIAERIHKTIAASQAAVDEQQNISYTVSIGIADNSTKEKAFDEILDKADKALYEAKNKSRNCTVVYREPNT